MTKHFAKWADKHKIPEDEIALAFKEIQAGNFEVNLGGHIYKKRSLNRGEIMRKSIAKSIMSTVRDLEKIGLVDDITMRNFENLCISEVPEYTPEKIVYIRKKSRLSQAALASVFNISPSTVKKWEQGVKKPAGASRKLLYIMERKGLEALM